MEPIAQGIAARGHEVHLVAPWHPKWDRPKLDGGVHFHLFHYAPFEALNTFGYAESMHGDVRLRASAIAVAPLAVLAGWFKALRVATKKRATLVHAHWVVPGGVIGAAAAGSTPLVISLHGSDVFVAERHAAARMAARHAFARARWITACSEDLRTRAVAIGARAARSSVIPYGVDSQQFRPDAESRARGREWLGIADNVPLVVAIGRLVKKKGFEHLIDAAAVLRVRHERLRIAIAGEGDLGDELSAHARTSGVADTVQFLGRIPHHAVPMLLAAADIAVAPSVRDAAGNVDGLPNTVMEIMASGTPLVATRAGGIGAVAIDGTTARLVPEGDAQALAAAISGLLDDRTAARALGAQARALVSGRHSWTRVAEEFESVYNEAVQ
jgi:glycosyltransferase involved in cell wall biosynthesis